MAMAAELFWWFLLYSLGGFVLESIFARITHSPRRDRKCHLLLPVCPVYGLGGVLLALLPREVAASPLLLVLAGAAVCTAAEWCLSLFYEKAAGTAFWDYSACPGNLQGRVCPLFSLFGGLLALPMVYLIHPAVAAWTAAAPPLSALPLALLYVLDAALSLPLLRRGGPAALRWENLRASAAR